MLCTLPTQRTTAMHEQITHSTKHELLDVVDDFGDPTGQSLEKQYIHDNGILHRDVHVWITNGQDFLQQQRNFNKSIMPGAWDITVGGHVGVGESFLEAAIQETSEELGLDFATERFVRIGRVAAQLSFPGWQHTHNTVGDNFVIYEPGLRLTDVKLQESEVCDARWYPLDQLEQDLVRPDTRLRHAPQPQTLYALGLAGMRGVSASL